MVNKRITDLWLSKTPEKMKIKEDYLVKLRQMLKSSNTSYTQKLPTHLKKTFSGRRNVRLNANLLFETGLQGTLLNTLSSMVNLAIKL